MSILFLEIVSIWLLLISFIKNIGNWKKNVFSTFVFCFLGYLFLDNISKHKDLTVFSSGSPLCTSYDEGGGVCIYYDALFVFMIGQILWSYNAMSELKIGLETKDVIYYTIHTIPVFGLISGNLFAWDLKTQLSVDLGLITVCILNGDLNLFSWICFFESKRFEQFDRSNSRHVFKNIQQSSSTYNSADDDVDDDDDDNTDDEMFRLVSSGDEDVDDMVGL
jgi:hypothetical protein